MCHLQQAQQCRRAAARTFCVGENFASYWSSIVTVYLNIMSCKKCRLWLIICIFVAFTHLVLFKASASSLWLWYNSLFGSIIKSDRWLWFLSSCLIPLPKKLHDQGQSAPKCHGPLPEPSRSMHKSTHEWSGVTSSKAKLIFIKYIMFLQKIV